MTGKRKPRPWTETEMTQTHIDIARTLLNNNELHAGILRDVLNHMICALEKLNERRSPEKDE